MTLSDNIPTLGHLLRERPRPFTLYLFPGFCFPQNPDTVFQPSFMKMVGGLILMAVSHKFYNTGKWHANVFDFPGIPLDVIQAERSV